MGVRSTGSQHPTTTEADGHLLEYFRQNFGAGGGGTNYVAPPPSGLTATGGVINEYTIWTCSLYRAHIFTSTGTFDVTALAFGNIPNNIEYLVVAGGGGGGEQHGGGGGAGGLLTNLSGYPVSQSAYPVSVGPYTVEIGAGGVAKVDDRGPGSNTNFYPSPFKSSKSNVYSCDWRWWWWFI